jgi:hypothetical protein
MARVALLVTLAVVAVGTTGAGAAAAIPIAQLLGVATQLTGLRPTAPIRVTVLPEGRLRATGASLLDRGYPRARQAHDEAVLRALGVLPPGAALRPLLLAARVAPARWLVEPGGRKVDVAAGPTAATTRAYAVAGLARALQQSRHPLSPSRADGDRAIAGEAAAEGAAAFAVRGLPGVALPPVRTATVAAAFTQLEGRFPRTSGLRLAAGLYDVGDTAAAASLLHDPPATTEQVLHIDKYLEHERPAAIQLPVAAAGFTLGSRDTFGELDVRALVAAFRLPGAERTAAGWGGGMSALYRDGSGTPAVVLRLDWDTEGDAAQWEQAVPAYVAGAFGAPPAVPCAVRACWGSSGTGVAFARSGLRSVLVVGASVDAGARVALALVP